jgi:hypothetical protein
MAALNPWSKPGNLSYRDYLIFMLSEEDKNSDRGVAYWFAILDLNGDGYISPASDVPSSVCLWVGLVCVALRSPWFVLEAPPLLQYADILFSIARVD